MSNIKILLFILCSYMLHANAQNNPATIHASIKDTYTFDYTEDIISQFPALQSIHLQIPFEVKIAIPWTEETYASLSQRAIAQTGSDASVQHLKKIIVFVSFEEAQQNNLLELLQGTALFDYVEAEHIITPPPPPADIPPVTPSYYHLQGYLREDSGVNITYAWSKGIFGQHVAVFDVEYGVNLAHEQLEDQPVSILSGMTVNNNASVEYKEHGTAAISVVCSDKLDYGNIGMMHGITAMTLVPEWTEEHQYNRIYAVSKAIAAAQVGDVIMYEMQTGLDNPTDYVMAEYNNTIWSMTRAAVDAGIVIVAAAGNGGIDLDNDRRLASYRSKADNGSIIVGAGSSDGQRKKMGFSTYGSRVNVQGWGEGVISAGYGRYSQIGNDFNQFYTMFSGTSSATPIVASCAIAIQSYYYSKTNEYLNSRQIRTILMSTGKPQGLPNTQHIGPLPNIKQAFDYVDSLITAEPNLISKQNNLEKKINVYPNPTQNIINIGVEEQDNIKHIYIFNTSGKLMHLSDKYKETIDIATYPNGTYLIMLLSKDKNIYRTSFTVAR